MRPGDKGSAEWDELHYAETGDADQRVVGWPSTSKRRDVHAPVRAPARDALRWARTRDTRVLVLEGGADFFSNGIHLHDIEASAQTANDSAADAPGATSTPSTTWCWRCWP